MRHGPKGSDLEAREREQAARVAAGEEPATLVLRDGRVVDVFTGRVRRVDVALAGARIARVGNATETIAYSTRVIDCDGGFILPGFVEPHFHIGGSQLTIERLAEVLVPLGTTTLGTCFYELAFISGKDAVVDMLDRADGIGLDVLLSPFHAAALGLGQFGTASRTSLDDLRELLNHPSCVELREWSAHVNAIPLDGIKPLWHAALSERKMIGGHLEGLTPELVQASAALGVCSDHETATAEEAIERIHSGLIVQARSGSAARDLEEIVRAITEQGLESHRLSMSTDEQELSSLLRHGHIDHKLRLAVRQGVPPIEAVRMATLNAAASMGIDADCGAVTPGRLASLVLVEDLASFTPLLVLSRGVVSAEGGAYSLNVKPADYRRYTGTVNVSREVTPADFRLPLPDGRSVVRVIGVTEGSLVTDELVEEVFVADGALADPQGLAKITVIDRYAGGSFCATGLVRGLGIQRGAIAATVNPGVMNLLVLGIDDDMVLAANRVVAMDGGICVCRDGEVIAEVALPVFGILSEGDLIATGERCLAIESAIHEALGSSFDGLLTAAGFACLAVSIPSLKICDRGLVRVSRTNQEAVKLEVHNTID